MPPTPPADDPARTAKTQQEFLASYDASRFPHPSVTVDVALITHAHSWLYGLLLRRDQHPFKTSLALPGGFVGIDESLDDAAARVLSEKTGLSDVFIEQLYSFGRVDRDPRTRVITVAYYALVHMDRFGDPSTLPKDTLITPLVVDGDGEDVERVTPVDGDLRPLDLAFDHGEILTHVIRRIRGKLDYAPIGFQLLPSVFTLRQLQEVHECVSGTSVNKASFRRRMLASGLLEATGKLEEGVPFRPAELYRFTRSSAV